MNMIIIRAIGVALLGGLAAFLAFGPGAAYGLHALALLLGWASYSRFGGKLDGLAKSVAHSLAGAILGLAAIAFATQHAEFGRSVDFPIWAAIGVAVTLALLVLATRVALFADFVALLLGYAAMAGTAQGVQLEDFLAPSLGNPALGAVLSLLIGALLACGADMLAEALGRTLPGRRPRADRLASV
jgi:hypothetical protein